MNEDRSLRATAILICIIAVLIASLSGLCSIIFAANSRADTLGFFGIGAIGFVPFGLLAFAMFRHIKRGPNLLTEIIAGLIGLILGLFGVFGSSFLAGRPGILNVMFAIPGLLILGWAIWSFSHRLKPQQESSNDPFS